MPLREQPAFPRFGYSSGQAVIVTFKIIGALPFVGTSVSKCPSHTRGETCGDLAITSPKGHIPDHPNEFAHGREPVRGARKVPLGYHS